MGPLGSSGADRITSYAYDAANEPTSVINGYLSTLGFRAPRSRNPKIHRSRLPDAGV
jgi:hypothetical protein